MPEDLRQELTTEQRLENAVRRRPERYIAERDGEGHLVSVNDADAGRLWVRIAHGWAWME